MDARSTAVISDCGAYRFSLGRTLSETGPTACFIMLNPSTADAAKNDPTIRKCIGFATRWGCSSLLAVNLFAIRSTDPMGIRRSGDPIGPDNDSWIVSSVKQAQSTSGPVVAAWGNHGGVHGRGPAVARMLIDAGVDLRCLGTTRDGHPLHPLHLAYATQLVKYHGLL